VSPSRLSSRSLSARIGVSEAIQLRRDQLDVERSLPLGGCALTRVAVGTEVALRQLKDPNAWQLGG
jgi:hypothetical protein